MSIAAEAADERRKGLLAGFGAYALWGLFPLYWPLLAPAGALEILSHRITWSLVFLAAVNWLQRGWGELGRVLRQRRSLGLLTLAAVLITVNWGLYIWAVVNGRVIEAALGYFINPLVNIALGVFVFRERLRFAQWSAVAIAALGVIWLTVDRGALPWVGLTLGVTFSLYGMVKKVAGVDAVASLTVETLLLAPFSTAYLVLLQVSGTLAFLHAGFWQATWALMAGAVTAIPLLMFGLAANRLPYSTMGLMQYISPTVQFLCGYLLLGEQMGVGRWIGFSIIWLALVVFSADAIRHSERFAQSEE